MNIINTGIYQIINIKNGKIYVGGAYRSFDKRWYQHKNLLNKGKHHNKHLQRAWNKYGEAWFVFNVIERCGPDKQIIADREAYWIKTLDSINPAKGYNKSPTGLGGRIRGVEINGCRVEVHPCCFYLTDEQTELLREWGNGNISAGTRWLIESMAPLIHKVTHSPKQPSELPTDKS